MTSRRWKTSNQCWNNIVYVNVEIYNVEQSRINFVYFNIDINNVKQHRNNVEMFNVEFHNADPPFELFELQKRIKERKENWNWIHKTASLDYYFKLLLTLLPTLRETWRRIFAKPRKFLLHRENAVLQELYLSRLTL